MHRLTTKMIWISSDWKHVHWGNCVKWSQGGYRNFTRASDVIGEADITVKNQ